MKTLIISSYPPRKPGQTVGWEDLAQYTCASHRKYAQKHGYGYHLDVSDLHQRARSHKWHAELGDVVPIRQFIKFDLFQHFLHPEKCREEWDWVVWLDSDLLITNFDIPLEKWMNGQPGSDEPQHQLGDIVLTHDVNGIHATVIMIRRTPYTLGFVWACNNAGRTYFLEDGWADQAAMRFFLQTPPYNSLVWYHSVKTLCAMPPNVYPIPDAARRLYEWDKDESFALHLSALSIPKRIEIAKEYTERLALL